jgi:hypothetical protein
VGLVDGGVDGDVVGGADCTGGDCVAAGCGDVVLTVESGCDWMLCPVLPGEFTPDVSGVLGEVVTGSRSFCAAVALPGLFVSVTDLSVATPE